MLGCWKRRYIRFKDGICDTSTDVIWIQTKSAMVDIRIPRRILDFTRGESLQDYSIEQLLELAAQDCSTGITILDESSQPYATASWHSDDNDAFIQPVSVYPEDGWLDWQQDGSCMMEWAPSGAYEEDWRLQTDSRTYVAEFRNTNPEKCEFLFVAGEHAAYVRGRVLQLNEARLLQDIALDAKENKDRLVALVDVEFSYATRRYNDEHFSIVLSTLPFREGQKLTLDFLLSSETSEINDPVTGDSWLRISQCSLI